MFIGSGTALITPFRDEKVDFDALAKLIDFQLANDTDALIVLGTTGESCTLSQIEKNEIIKFAISKVKRSIPVIIGTGSNNTAVAIENSKNAEKLGADGILVVTPYYNKCTQKGLLAHYNVICDAVGIPVIAYNVPGRTAVNILPETMARIAEHKNMAAIKEASGNLEQIAKTLRLIDGKCDLYSGDDALTVPIMKLGGKGIISVCSNITPKYIHELAYNCINGNLEAAEKMQSDYSELISALFSEVSPIPVKMAASFMGFCSPDMRLPLTTMENETSDKLNKIMKGLGIIR